MFQSVDRQQVRIRCSTCTLFWVLYS